jgi:23S rRNA pseudouridine1911/1915/1917 synthase
VALAEVAPAVPACDLGEPEVDVSGGIERFVVSAEGAGQRLDRILTARASVGSRRRAAEVVDTGKVWIDGRCVLSEEKGLPVPEGASVEIQWNRPGSGAERKKGERGLAHAGLRILHDDGDMIAIDKPPGLLTDTADAVQAKERDSVKKRLAAFLRPRGLEPIVCHRIDRDTSGVVLFACHPRAGEALREQFATHQPERIYWCAVRGVPEPRTGVWEDPMVWDRSQLLQKIVAPHVSGAVVASARYETLYAGAEASIVQVQLNTGRRNQIRVHAMGRGYPLLGERLYTTRSSRPLTWEPPRQALHAWKVTVVHPTRGHRVTFESELPPDLVSLERRIRQG